MNKNQQEHLKNETIKRKEEFMTRRTKIICTLGPSTDNEAVMRALIEEGMNVARFNFSHGPHDEQMGRLKMLRKLRKELGKYVAALLDTKGPEIRLVEFEKGKTELKTGQTFTLTTDDILGTDEDVLSRRLEDEVEISLLSKAISKLSPREQTIIRLRFGLGKDNSTEKTQKEVADFLGISQSYISRLEKRIMKRLKKEIVKYE